MNESLRSELVGTSGLALAAAAALVLTILRAPAPSQSDARRRTAALFVAGLMIYALHFLEEYATRFYERFPPVLGLSPWPAGFFIVFNLSWLLVWVLAAPGLRAGYRVAYFPVWFFAIAMMGNGVAHPLLSVYARGYFPGLITSPLAGIVGFWLWSRLRAITESAHGKTRTTSSSPNQ